MLNNIVYLFITSSLIYGKLLLVSDNHYIITPLHWRPKANKKQFLDQQEVFWYTVWGTHLLWIVSFSDHGYGTCEIDWNKANYSTIYKSYIISILFSCFCVPVLIMLFSYISIISVVKTTSNAMTADGYITERHRKVERDVTRVSSSHCLHSAASGE